jgi:ribosome assembly protein 1
MAEHEAATDGAAPLQQIDERDEPAYFSPDAHNVLFASAIDGWAFVVEDFASACARKTGIDEQVGV